MGADHARSALSVRLRSAAALLALVAASCDAPTANGPTFGYDPSLSYADANGDVQQFLYRWPLGAAVRVFVELDGQPADWDLASAVDDGARRWEREMFYREVTLRRVDGADAADVAIHFDGAPPVVELPAGCGFPFVQAAGVTVLCPNTSFTGLETLPLATGASAGGGHVKIDVTIVRSRIADAAQFQRVVAHELGHVFGIGAHSGNREDLMFPVPQVGAPSAADGRTLRYVLHNRDAVTP